MIDRDSIKNKVREVCQIKLKEKYGVGIYEDSKIITEQLSFVTNCCVDILETCCNNKLDLLYYFKLMMAYKTISDIPKDEECIWSSDDMTLIKRVLLLVIGQASKVDLIDNKNYTLSDSALLQYLFFFVEIGSLLYAYSDNLYRYYCGLPNLTCTIS